MIQGTVNEKNALTNIFPKDTDKYSQDLLAISDFIPYFITNEESEIQRDGLWKDIGISENLLGVIALAIKNGADISKSKILIADSSHFSEDIKRKLASKEYHIGISKETPGNFRPAILDDKERAVKFFTLKKSFDPTKILSNISTLTIQSSLHQIALQIKNLDDKLEGLINHERRIDLSNKFCYARDRIIHAIDNPDNRETYLIQADTYLMEGLENLYSDINGQIKALVSKDKKTTSLKTIDSILRYINEDMQMIPKYVSLRQYLLRIRGLDESASRVIEEYVFNLQKWNSNTIEGKDVTPFELIHQLYDYDESNLNYWIEKPKQLLEKAQDYQNLLKAKEMEVYYIE